ncbi:hypothetical protein BDB00DRAFT_845180 [Zychaea mexicana]|uniref:uncharacterized protein n=1 Tax=Zychaea mexicana TaxID=64656 RepID=UPI0022FE945B|nr:uncharacterized protein BDB00DRAFT_845180 [Zychaea mexicana]KAI9489098.1 hypothetical protein BDB00DRAFT_845180 [Zychaea mexicana]
MSSLFAEQSNDLLSPQQNAQQQRRRSSVDIRGQSVAPDILVALLDRPQEMRILASRNPKFYEALENYITETQGLDAWVQFQDIAYAPRDDLPDRDWMAAIAKFLKQNPVFLTKFKESVGYYDNDDEDGHSIRSDDDNTEDEEIATSSGGEDDFAALVQERGEFDEDSPPPRRKSSQLMHPALVVAQDATGPQQRQPAHHQQHYHSAAAQRSVLATLRDYPDIQARLPLMCPAFFRKVRQRMACPPASKLSSAARRNSILEDTIFEEDNGEDNPRFSFCDQEESFECFQDAVTTTRREQPDDQRWLHSVVESLEGYPELLDNLREIAASLDDAHDQQQYQQQQQ